MTNLELLRWKLNKAEPQEIYCSYRKGGFIQKSKNPLTPKDIKLISGIAEENNINIRIEENRIYIKE